ncbi:hypothetical protein GCM10023082_42540 [Streptomyces tremellae]|uniref:Secreted protein n=1 Tax=Streptomyces tremellae TaxID=1124239 RepID=A0ABP7FPV1_9ACTN
MILRLPSVWWAITVFDRGSTGRTCATTAPDRREVLGQAPRGCPVGGPIGSDPTALSAVRAQQHTNPHMRGTLSGASA